MQDDGEFVEVMVFSLLLSCLILRLSVFSHNLVGLDLPVLPLSEVETRLLGFLDNFTLDDTGVLIRIDVDVNNWTVSILSEMTET